MNSRKRFATQAAQCLILLLILAPLGAQAAGGQVIAGSYRITDWTDLGTNVRVTLDIRLTNSSDDRLFITKIGLRGLLHPAVSNSEEAAVILEPHSSSDVIQQFTIVKGEYKLLRKGAQPRLLLKVQGPSDTETTIAIPLVRRP